MKNRKMMCALLIAACLSLAACASTQSNNKPVLFAAPAGLVAPCRGPVGIPHRELTQGEVERLWRNDRSRLVLCRDKHSGLVRFYKRRDQALSGG